MSVCVNNKSRYCSMENINEYIAEVEKLYSKFINKEQLCKIAHISKKTAKYLLDNKIIASSNTGKKTRCYKIKLEDVIKYLKNRELEPFRYKVSNLKKRKGLVYEPNGFTLISEIRGMNEEQVEQARIYLIKKLDNYPDLMSVIDLADLLGYNICTLYRYCRSGSLKIFIINNKYLIPKPCVIDFIICKTEGNPIYKTYRHLELIKKVIDAIGN